jgi:hypothetical protein
MLAAESAGLDPQDIIDYIQGGKQWPNK